MSQKYFILCHILILADSSGYLPHKSIHGQWKRKKGPAPSLPIPQRRNIKPMAMERIRQELGDIEVKQQELERQGVALEQKIREKFDSGITLILYLYSTYLNFSFVELNEFLESRRITPYYGLFSSSMRLQKAF